MSPPARTNNRLFGRRVRLFSELLGVTHPCVKALYVRYPERTFPGLPSRSFATSMKARSGPERCARLGE